MRDKFQHILRKQTTDNADWAMFTLPPRGVANYDFPCYPPHHSQVIGDPHRPQVAKDRYQLPLIIIPTTGPTP